MAIVILYRNKWIFGKIRVIMMLLSEMRVTMALEYRKIVNKNEFSERGWIYGSYQSGCGCSGWYVGGSVDGVFLLCGYGLRSDGCEGDEEVFFQVFQ